MKRIADRFVRIFRRKNSSRLYLKIYVPPHLQKRVRSDPLFVGLRRRRDYRGRIRLSMRRLPMAEVRQIADQFERVLRAAEASDIVGHS